MKTFIQALVFVALACHSTVLIAQTTTGEKVKTVAEKVNQQATKAAQTTQEVSTQLQSAGQQVQATVANIKAIIRVFEPIFHLRRKKVAADSTVVVMTMPTVTSSTDTAMQAPVLTPAAIPTQSANSVFVPESNLYNADGSANLGNQNHQDFGCYLDMMRGQVLDDITVATETYAVDLIFTATDHFGNAPVYALLTPAYVKNDFFANYYFRGIKYKDANVPPKTWPQVNESQVALTNLTGVQFERVQNNNQLAAIVQQMQGFRDHVESRTKLTGKVFAVKTEMGNRTCYGLLYVVEHLGTTGANGYLKVKLKVTGFDQNGDGNPDGILYVNR
ncbi:MAG: hypothetical protein U0Y10_02425 [Spirosomataceae bacterium]